MHSSPENRGRGGSAYTGCTELFHCIGCTRSGSNERPRMLRLVGSQWRLVSGRSPACICSTHAGPESCNHGCHAQGQKFKHVASTADGRSRQCAGAESKKAGVLR